VSGDAVLAAYRVLPRPLLCVLHALLLAAAAVIGAVRWWGGEPLFLRVSLCAGYGWCAVVVAAVAAWLTARGRGCAA
jgi:hypothetical protein